MQSVEQVLKAGCQQQVAVDLQPMGRQGNCVASFDRLTDDHLVLSTEDPSDLRSLALCLGTMPLDGKVRTFCTNIMQIEKSVREVGCWKIWMIRPTQILSSEARLAYRVRVIPEVSAWLHNDEEPNQSPVEMRLCEVSSTGALLSWSEASRNNPGTKPLSEQQTVRLEVKYGRITVGISAQIRSCEGGRVALCFPQATERGMVAPDPKWANLVVALERVWLRERAASHTEVVNPPGNVAHA